jgi:hypothetical protein
MTYTDIYDFDGNIFHSTPRKFVEDDGVSRWRYYEGYARNSGEKRDFLESINNDHRLWSNPLVPRGKTKTTFAVALKSITFTLCSETAPQSTVTESPTDMRDRSDRPTAVFAKQLCDYVEKVTGVEDRLAFFDSDGWGHKWSKNRRLMLSLVPLFKKTKEQFDDPDFKLSLSDQAIKRSTGGYPRGRFCELYDVFMKYMKRSSQLNPSAKAFTPSAKAFTPSAKAFTPSVGGIVAQRPIESPQQLSVVCQIPCSVKQHTSHPVDSPNYRLPPGIPPPRRPTASCKGSSAWDKHTWQHIDSLNKKLDLLVAMYGPVVQAESV